MDQDPPERPSGETAEDILLDALVDLVIDRAVNERPLILEARRQLAAEAVGGIGRELVAEAMAGAAGAMLPIVHGALERQLAEAVRRILQAEAASSILPQMQAQHDVLRRSATDANRQLLAAALRGPQQALWLAYCLCTALTAVVAFLAGMHAGGPPKLATAISAPPAAPRR